MSDDVHDMRVEVVSIELGDSQNLVKTVVFELALQYSRQILTLDRRRKPLNEVRIDNHVLPMRKL